MKRFAILYVDDDIDDFEIISGAIEQYTNHLRVVHASNSFEGLELLRKMSEEASLPCLVIIDINMPIMDGKQMLQEIRAEPQYKNLPAILFSTSHLASDQKFAAENDAELVFKPSSYTEIKFLVERLVSKCRFEANNSGTIGSGNT